MYIVFEPLRIRESLGGFLEHFLISKIAPGVIPDITGKVDKTQKIAGVDMQDDITTGELYNAMYDTINPNQVVIGTSDGKPAQYGRTPDFKPVFCKKANTWVELAQKADIPDVTGKMDLNVNVPFDSTNDRPDTETAAFNALPLGQVFSSQANAVNPRYWVKYRVPNSNIYSARELITTHQDVSEKMDLPPTIASPYSGMFNNLPQGQLYCNTQGKYFIKDAYYGSGGDGKVQLLTEHQDISGKENTSNKVTALSAQSTDEQYPSAKCVFDLIGDVESLLSAI